ncbi:hypothetical protein [Lactiplantibacillus pentosus]|uniref:hypothetical protein n=1 Tax=Lactiplantibacillus pentosus TaxID=1589 RepID=UPI00067B79E0|nr:hypothetical protein [Lactiplantibacillus pentosus]AYJ40706.1 hypothetical protein LP314_01685 [Lactiplantibacillus pentosus]MCC3161847.1 hypothetical protein [Lactiplantibacillus pentosus]MCJ8187792.1 hypothetical protein [Lactiplantibacillus pentosus]MCT3295830.1 hypothetical protein [Lactiplantibacillus pentosus]MCT3300926.1 hypothetical protein [Lactiplantibacillus pentosus]
MLSLDGAKPVSSVSSVDSLSGMLATGQNQTTRWIQVNDRRAIIRLVQIDQPKLVIGQFETNVIIWHGPLNLAAVSPGTDR